MFRSRFVIAAFLVYGDTLNGAISYTAINYGAANSDELDAFNRINAFRTDPQNGLYNMFVGEGYGGTKADFDTLLNGQATHTANWWATKFGGNLATWSMDAFGTVPSTLNSQFAALPAAGTLSPYTWSNNIGWSSHQYSVWLEHDAGISGAHTVAGAPTLGNRFTQVGVNWTNVGENVARNWPHDVSLMHMGFAVDWGSGIDGIQSPPGHRNAMLSSTFTQLGIAVIDTAWTIGNYSQTQHFAAAFSTDPIFYGYVTDEASGIELEGVQVEVFDFVGNSLGTTTTDARGAYTIEFTGGTPNYAIFGTNQSNIPLGTDGLNFFIDAAIPEPSITAMLLLGLCPILQRKRGSYRQKLSSAR